MENKICKQCGAEYKVSDEYRELLDKLAPEIGGKKFPWPVPGRCWYCRSKERMTFRNIWALYRRKCDATGQDMVSMFKPECQYKIYHRDYWYSDKWNPMSLGRDYDPNRSFFAQLKELFLEVPLFHNSVADDENSDFSNNSNLLKNCYMTQDSTESENCLYGNAFGHSRDCVDCTKAINCEGCYEVVNGYDCYECYYSRHMKNCAESYWLDSCTGCRNCFGCKNLRGKQYYVLNEPKSREEYEQWVRAYREGDRAYRWRVEARVRALWQREPNRFAQVYGCEESSGDYLENCRQVKDCLLVDNSENVRYSMVINRSKDFMDVESFGLDSQRVYNSVTVGLNANNVCFCNEVWEKVTNVYYSWFCGRGTKDCFGCAGLRGKQYCVLNKQYSANEYEELVGRIVEKMMADGEWGRFFPPDFAPFGYNETIANEYYPLEKEAALALGASWYDRSEPNYDFADYYVPLEIGRYNPEVNVGGAGGSGGGGGAQAEIDKCLAGVVKCELTGRPFRIIAQELAFYIKRGLPVPVVHPDERRRVRNLDINRAKFYERQCDCSESGHGHDGGRCEAKFETTYAPERAERVYCEGCYQICVQ